MVRFLLLITALTLVSMSTQAAPSTGTLTVMTYNIHVGIPMGHNARSYKSTQLDLRNLADVITSAGADVVGLQEVHCELAMLAPPERQFTSALNQARMLAGFAGLHYVFGSTLDDLPGYPPNTRYLEWGTAARWTNNGETHGEFGNAVLSRFRFAGAPENIELPRAGDQEQRACMRVALEPRETSGTPIIIYNTHLHHNDPAIRVAQLEAVLNRAAGESSGTLAFVMGDLNWRSEVLNSAETRGLNELLARFGFHDLAVPGGADGAVPEPTFSSERPDRRIDYVLCNQKLTPVEVRVIPSRASDHMPLLVRLELPNK